MNGESSSMCIAFSILMLGYIYIYIVSGNPCGMSRSWPAESRWDPWWNRWDPRRDFTQDCGLPQVDPAWAHPILAGSWVGSHPRRSIIPVGIPPGIKTGSRLGSHPGLAGSRVGSHLRRSIIPVGIPPGIKTGSCLGSHPRLAGSGVGSHPRRSIILVRIPPGILPIPPGIPLGIKTGSRLGSHPGLGGSWVGSQPRRSIIPVGIPPGIKTGSRLGFHPRLAGSHLGLRRDPGWDRRDPASHFYLGYRDSAALIGGGLDILSLYLPLTR